MSLNLEIGDLFWIVCEEGKFPFFLRVKTETRGKFDPLFTPPEFNKPGKYLVMCLGYALPEEIGLNRYDGQKFVKFLTASGIWHLFTTSSTNIESFIEKV